MKKILSLILALVLMTSLFACADAAAEGEKSFTLTIVHADGTEKNLNYTTAETKLGVFLEAEGVIESEGADDGMFHTVDGEKADWNVNQSYWAFYVGEEYAMTGIYATDITDGAVYKLVYTIG